MTVNTPFSLASSKSYLRRSETPFLSGRMYPTPLALTAYAYTSGPYVVWGKD